MLYLEPKRKAVSGVFLLRNEKELLEVFRPLDRRAIEIPSDVKFPLIVRDYFAWPEPSNDRRINLVFAEQGSQKPLGIRLKRDAGSGGTPAHCEWCHSTAPSSQIGLLTIEVSDRRTLGIYLCLDLGCKARLENLEGLEPRVAQARMKSVLERMAIFARRHLY